MHQPPGAQGAPYERVQANKGAQVRDLLHPAVQSERSASAVEDRHGGRANLTD